MSIGFNFGPGSAPSAAPGMWQPGMSMSQLGSDGRISGNSGVPVVGPGGFDYGAIFAGLMSYLGSRETNRTNRRIADAANALSQSQAREQMAFQENMSNTALQRYLSDAKAAGLNPLLGMSSGGASTPSGAQGSVNVAKVENELAGIATSALEGRRLNMQQQMNEGQLGLMNDQRNLTKAQTLKTTVDAEVARKGIPGSEIKNKLYKVAEPYIDKLVNGLSTDARPKTPTKLNNIKIRLP